MSSMKMRCENPDCFYKVEIEVKPFQGKSEQMKKALLKLASEEKLCEQIIANSVCPECDHKFEKIK